MECLGWSGLAELFRLPWVSLAAQMLKNLPANTEDLGLIPGSGRSPGEAKGNPLQYSCLENPMPRGAWWATVRGVTKSRTRLSTRSCEASQLRALSVAKSFISEFHTSQP